MRLVRIRVQATDLTDEEVSLLTGAIQQFSDMERRVERSLNTQVVNLSSARLNEVVSKQMDGLNQLLAALTRRLGGDDG